MKLTTYNLSCPYFINGHKNVNGMAICDSINQDAMAQDRSDSESWFMDNLDSDDAELYQISIVKSECLDGESEYALDRISTLKTLLEKYEDFIKNHATKDNVQDDYESLLDILHTAIDGLENC